MEQLQFWHWWVLALALGIVEMLAPGAAFLWLALAAGLVGLALLALPDLAWQSQFIAFAMLAVALVAASKFLIPKPRPEETDQPTLNRRGEHYVGRTFILESAIVQGRGRAIVGDTLWTVSGPEGLPAGETVRVVAADGALLRVERALVE
ncbi:MAG TPA: NfeD family protein [Azospirillaceae bacterium]|nr:NfeD family protein [Azospirillaceae bacterium]